MKGISLFSSAGIGELGLENNGIEIIAANELVPNRASLYKENHPVSKMFQGDVWVLKNDFISYVRQALKHDDLFVAFATPPCQGMSTNSYGKLKAEVLAGNRPKNDPRNDLIIPALDIISALKPRWVVFENVPGMRNTVINTQFGLMKILDYVKARLGSDYVGGGEVINFCDLGVPQSRNRLISIYTRCEKGKSFYFRNKNSFFKKSDKVKPISLREAIGGLPPLDSREGKNTGLNFNQFHYVSVMKEDKYWWVAHTKEGDTAFNNQCVNNSCGFKGNARHIDIQEGGKWVSSKQTPIYCFKCGGLLPRPTVVDRKTGEKRLIRGFHSAYRRMEWDKPARAVTRNFPFEASDNKIHPEQNRTISVYEAMVLQTITDYPYSWKINGKIVRRGLICDVIGESVPPKIIDLISNRIVKISADLESSVNRQEDFFDYPEGLSLVSP